MYICSLKNYTERIKLYKNCNFFIFVLFKTVLILRKVDFRVSGQLLSQSVSFWHVRNYKEERKSRFWDSKIYFFSGKKHFLKLRLSGFPPNPSKLFWDGGWSVLQSQSLRVGIETQQLTFLTNSTLKVISSTPVSMCRDEQSLKES